MNEMEEMCREKLWALPAWLGWPWHPMKQAGEWQSHDPLAQQGTERWHHPGRHSQKKWCEKQKIVPFAVLQSLHKYLFVQGACVRGQKASPAKCHSGLTQHSAETWATAFHPAGTHCVELTDRHRKLREAKQQADEKVRMWLGDGWGPHVQLVVDIGSVPQQSVHRLSVSVLGRYGESRAAVLQGNRQQMWQVIPGSSNLVFVAAWITAWDDHIFFHNPRPCQRKPLCPATVPLFGIRWRRRTQRGASRHHCDPAGRRRRVRSSLSGESDKNRRSCLLFWQERLSMFVWGMPKRKELKSLVLALCVTKNRPEELHWDKVSGW